MLQLAVSDGVAPNPPRLSAGVVLLVAYMDALVTSRVPSARRNTMMADLIAHRARLLDVLEIGARLRAPMFPSYVPQDAVRGLATLVKLAPNTASDVLLLLMRCAVDNFTDTGADILAVMVDVLGARFPTDCVNLAALLTSLLEALAMGQSVDDRYVSRLVLLTEVVVGRCVAASVAIDALLNAFMGVTTRCASTEPPAFVACLDTWLLILDIFVENDVSQLLVNRVHMALSKLALDKCLCQSNAGIAELEAEGFALARSLDWSDMPNLTHIVEEPVAFSSMLFQTSVHADSFEYCTREAYLEKCVEVLVAICIECERARADMAAFCATFISNAAAKLAAGERGPSLMADLSTVLSICISLIPMLGVKHRELLVVICDVLTGGQWTDSELLGVCLLRSAASCVKFLKMGNVEDVRVLGGRLLDVSKQVVSCSAAAESVKRAAAALGLSLHQFCGKILFVNQPPIDIKLIHNDSSPAISGLTLSSLVQWCLVPRRNEKFLPEKWSPDEWNMRMKMCREMCMSIFVDVVVTSESIERIFRMATLFHTATKAVYGVQGNTPEAVWQSFAKDTSANMTKFVEQLCQLMPSVNTELQSRIAHALCAILHAINSMLQTCRRQADTAIVGHIIQHLLPVAQVSVSLARATLILIREQLVINDSLLVPGVDLASRVVQGSEQDAAIAGLGVITEALKVHWNLFWPNQGSCSPQLNKCYGTAVNSLVHAVTQKELATTRVALLSFQSLHAARRVLSRKQAFRETWAVETVRQGVCIMGAEPGRESLFDEALDVVWGIAESNVSEFHAILAQIVGQWGMGDTGANIIRMEGVQGRNAFSRWIRDVVNDIAVWKLNNSANGGVAL